jgi:hypothetical protein
MSPGTVNGCHSCPSGKSESKNPYFRWEHQYGGYESENRDHGHRRARSLTMESATVWDFSLWEIWGKERTLKENKPS